MNINSSTFSFGWDTVRTITAPPTAPPRWELYNPVTQRTVSVPGVHHIDEAIQGQPRVSIPKLSKMGLLGYVSGPADPCGHPLLSNRVRTPRSGSPDGTGEGCSEFLDLAYAYKLHPRHPWQFYQPNTSRLGIHSYQHPTSEGVASARRTSSRAPAAEGASTSRLVACRPGSARTSAFSDCLVQPVPPVKPHPPRPPSQRVSTPHRVRSMENFADVRWNRLEIFRFEERMKKFQQGAKTQ